METSNRRRRLADYVRSVLSYKLNSDMQEAPHVSVLRTLRLATEKDKKEINISTKTYELR